MKEIKDNNNNILALFLSANENKKEKNFYTSNDYELQLASFRLEKGQEILRHYHPQQKREILNTSESLILFEGKLEISIYDKDNKFLTSETMMAGDVCLLISGGHSIDVIEDSNFIEVKQGPYDANTDKIRF